VPVDFSLEECKCSEGTRRGDIVARLKETVFFRGSEQRIRNYVLIFHEEGKNVRISFGLAGRHLSYAVSDAGGSIVQQEHFGRYAIATMLCGEPPQSVLGQAVFTLEVRPGGRAKHAVKKRIHLATDLLKNESSALCKIVGVPWTEK